MSQRSLFIFSLCVACLILVGLLIVVIFPVIPSQEVSLIEKIEDETIDMDDIGVPSEREKTEETQPKARAGTKSNTYLVTNPSSGSELYAKVFHPDDWDGQSLPTLILTPGGRGDSNTFTKDSRNSAETLANMGYTVVIFDPEGRGQSEGRENDNGYIGQDGLGAIIEFAADLPEVDPQKIGLYSLSYGVTLASGVMARYPELPIRFLIDWEGPSDRRDTGGCDEDDTGHLQEIAECDDEEFWVEREALSFIQQIQAPYQRLQSQKDHAQPDLASAVRMINAAIDGISPWVRLNEYPANQKFDEDDPPNMYEDSIDKQNLELVGRIAGELFTY